MCEWSIKKVVIYVILLQLTFILIINLSLLGIDIPVLRQVIGTINLLFVPGYLILRASRIHNLQTINALLYAVGLSLALIMFLGFVINLLLPAFGMLQPISLVPLTICICSSILLLCIVANKRDKDYSKTERHTRQKKAFLRPALLLFLILLFSVLGALLIAIAQSNLLSLLMIPVIVIISILIITRKCVPEEMYPYAIGVLALAILYQLTLFTPFIAGGSDIHLEFYYQKLVLDNARWDIALSHNVNSVLSVTILPPTFSLLLGMSTIWIHKILYPLIFALSIAGLFKVFQQQFGNRLAFIACFLFIGLIPVTAIVGLPRQQIAEFFLVLLFLIIVDNKMVSYKKRLLLIVFLSALVVSHYAIAFVLALLIILVLLQLLLLKSKRISKVLAKMSSNKIDRTIISAKDHPFFFDGRIIILFFVVLLGWNMFIASASGAASMASVGTTLVRNLVDIFSLQGKENIIGTALGLDWASVSIWGKAFRIIQYFVQGFLILGFATVFLQRRQPKLNTEFGLFAISALALLAISVIVPFFAAAINASRMYHIAFLFLSPFCVIGGITFFGWLSKAIQFLLHRIKLISGTFSKEVRALNYHKTPLLSPLLLMCAIIGPYFLFNTGFVFEATRSEEVAGEMPRSIVLSHERIDGYHRTLKDVTAASWLHSEIPAGTKIYGDFYVSSLVAQYLGPWTFEHISENAEVRLSGWLFWRSYNVENNKATILTAWRAQETKNLDDLPYIASVVQNGSVIYSNGSAQVLMINQ